MDELLLLSDTTAALLLVFAVDAPRRGDDLLFGVRVVDVGLAALVGVGLIIFQPFWKNDSVVIYDGIAVRLFTSMGEERTPWKFMTLVIFVSGREVE